MMRRAWRGVFIGAIASMLLSLALTGAATAQPAQLKVKPVGIDGVPERFVQVTAMSSGDVLLVPPPKLQKRGRPMSRVLASGSLYQIDPVVFGNPEWAAIKIDDAVEAPDQTLWAIGGDSVVYQPRGDVWQLIEMPQLNRNNCRNWEEFGVPCQIIVPVADDRAVVLRPRYQSGALSTEVYAIQQGERRPLGSVVLPGIALGPAIQDGEGGFWVMLRRTVKTSNYKPMRGYLHYTADGNWLMWSDSGESVEGTELVGKAPFLIDPNVRKMASDGAGGFYAIGRDRIIYHVDKNGSANRFSSDQPTCNYCQPMAIDFDETSGQLHLLLSEWREGDAGQIEIMGETRWIRFDGASGKVAADEPIPLPAEVMERPREVFEEVRLAAIASGVWIAAPGMLFHRDSSGWYWLTDVESAAKQESVEIEQARIAKANPQLAAIGTYGNLGLAVGGIGGAFGTVLARQAARENAAFTCSDLRTNCSVLDDGAAFYYTGVTWGLGGLAAWYPATLMYSGLYPEKSAGKMRGARVIGGGILATVATGLVVVFMGEGLAKSVEEDETPNDGSSSTSSFDTSGRAVAAAMGGAAVGTLGSVALMRLSIDYGAPEQEGSKDQETRFFWRSILGAAAISGMSTLSYVLFSERWQAERDWRVE